MGRIRKFGLAAIAALSVNLAAHASSTATLTVSGAETQRLDQSWDIGPIEITIDEPNYHFSETVYYGQASTPASIATQIAAGFTADYSQNGLTAAASSATVTFTRSNGAAFGVLAVANSGESFQLAGSGFAAYNWTPPGSTQTTFNSTVYMTNGLDSGTYYDTGTVTVRVSGAEVSTDWVAGSTGSSLATALASEINTAASGFVTASASGPTITFTSVNSGPSADMAISSSVADTSTDHSFTPSFSVSPANTSMTGGTATEGSLLYSFAIPDAGGYAPNGNLLSGTDSVMGQWTYNYDNLNRLLGGSAATSSAQGVSNYFAGTQATWTYDSFGNRTLENWGWTGSGTRPTMPTATTIVFTSASNQVSTNNGTSLTYDAAGDVIADTLNSYLYDAEGRLCAVKNQSGSLTGYIYDAAGIRVAKGSLSTFSCNFASNGFTPTTSWVLDQDGQQTTESAVSGAAYTSNSVSYTNTWNHTNVFAAGELLATYDSANGDTIFALNDWLGTKRVEIGTSGCASVFTSMPFGNGLPTSPVALTGYSACIDATEHHFTGKERDQESGNDYFGARYYASTMGRFLSPDRPFADQHKGNPQSWNLYSYTRNNPLRFVDDDGEKVNEVVVPKPYRVSGKTATEAWNNAPAASGIEGGFRGNTNWSIGIAEGYAFDRSLQTNNGSQTVTDTVTSGDVNLTVTITLPTWDGYSSASPGEQKQWDSLAGNLKGHEDGHKDIAEKNADSLDKSLPGTKATGTSDTVPDAVKKADSALGNTLHDKQNTTVDNTRQQQQTYDKKTTHGDN